VQRVSGSRPSDESWRADALVGSRHSRWVEELRQPLNLHDEARAAEICGQVSRLALQDFAPALLLLPRPHRQRLQTVTAYVLTLFDFVRQSGLEGERLTAINRWEFDLEAALDGQPAGQPVFVQIYALERQQPWARDGFDRLHGLARRRSIRLRPIDRQATERESAVLGECLAWLILGQPPTEPVARMASALVRLRGLLDLGDDLRRHRARLPISELPQNWSLQDGSGQQVLADAIHDECGRLGPMLSDRSFSSQVPKGLRAAARYSQRTAKRLLEQAESQGVSLMDSPPQIGLRTRLAILAQSRWF
jgi:phytoene/squalene synthetase